jgi:hypothetical protein
MESIANSQYDKKTIPSAVPLEYQATLERCVQFGEIKADPNQLRNRQQNYILPPKIPKSSRTLEELEFKRYRYLIFVAYLGRNYHGF